MSATAAVHRAQRARMERTIRFFMRIYSFSQLDPSLARTNLLFCDLMILFWIFLSSSYDFHGQDAAFAAHSTRG